VFGLALGVVLIPIGVKIVKPIWTSVMPA